MKRLLAVAGLILAVLSVQVLAQQQSKKEKKAEASLRSVEGVVVDANGSAVAGAVVHLKNTKTLQIRSFITKPDGTYAFHGLSTDVDYELKAESREAASESKTLSVFDSRNKAVINLKLKK